jgi:acetyltransferase-like isoleucine patch superfamily enzyme
MYHNLLRFVAVIDRFSQNGYRRASAALLRKSGVEVKGLPLWISPRTYWDISTPGSIRLGDRCVISHDVKILTHDYSLDRISERKFGVKPTEVKRTAPITIGDQSFIGMGVIILPGVSIGKGAIVGSGSVVTRDVPDDEVWAGNPARLLSTADDLWSKKSGSFTEQRRRM